MPVRGCGASRIAGGVYVTVPTSPLGLPMESFLIDPPRAFSREELAVMGVSPQGMSFMPGKPGDPMSLVDWVGSEHYPNTYDILAEIKAYGLSRRVQRTLNFKLLGPGSRIYLLHDRAWIGSDRMSLYEEPDSFVDRCPLGSDGPSLHGRVDPHDLYPMCVRLYRECVEGGHEISSDSPFASIMALGKRGVARQIGDVVYGARRAPDGVELSYSPAFFASFPIAGLEVVRDPIGRTHETALGKASQAGLPVTEVDE